MRNDHQSKSFRRRSDEEVALPDRSVRSLEGEPEFGIFLRRVAAERKNLESFKKASTVRRVTAGRLLLAAPVAPRR